MGRIVYPLLGFVSLCIAGLMLAMLRIDWRNDSVVWLFMGCNGPNRIHFEMIGFCGIDRGGSILKKRRIALV
jgi:hypothetical protein